MKFAVRTLRRAEADIVRTYAWIAQRSEQGAASWYRAVREAIQSLEEDAALHALAPESAELGKQIRQCFFKTRRGRVYRLLYTLVGNQVHVVRVRGPGQAPITADDVSE
ncbi:MAG TPA: type II toxin-antitoxin system RelE/ParE family toxin [Lacipirellulaceae bacterium]